MPKACIMIFISAGVLQLTILVCFGRFSSDNV